MNSTRPPLRLAFADIANPGWSAGANYYYNLFTSLKQVEAERRPHVMLVSWPGSPTSSYDIYRAQVDENLEAPVEAPFGVPAPKPRAGFWQRQLRKLSPPQAQPTTTPAAYARLADLLRQRAVDAIFGCWTEFGPAFPIATLGWIPDFQHVHLPNLFSQEELQQRDGIFAQMAANNTRIIVSSEAARRDFAQFSPAHTAKASVLRFVVQLPAGIYEADSAWISAEYHLPQRFVYMPDQFWRHKNHAVVLEALAQLKANGHVLTIVCTGDTLDVRDNHYFGELLATASRLGLRDNFVVLGWVPHRHIFHLMRQSLAVLQPSSFEGWSTTVEEAKALGKTVLLSDIPVHREQAPQRALYHEPGSAVSLAECLQQAWDECQLGPDEELETQARAQLLARTSDFATTFLEIVRQAAVEASSPTGPRIRPAAPGGL